MSENKLRDGKIKLCVGVLIHFGFHSNLAKEMGNAFFCGACTHIHQPLGGFIALMD